MFLFFIILLINIYYFYVVNVKDLSTKSDDNNYKLLI